MSKRKLTHNERVAKQKRKRIQRKRQAGGIFRYKDEYAKKRGIK